jgi:hypothetical protein
MRSVWHERTRSSEHLSRSSIRCNCMDRFEWTTTLVVWRPWIWRHWNNKYSFSSFLFHVISLLLMEENKNRKSR